MSTAAVLRIVLPGIVLGGALAMVVHGEAPPSSAIVVDQAGYEPGEQKVAYVADGAGPFTVVDADGKRVLSGTLGTARRADDAGRSFAPADFTALATPGAYAIRLTSGVQSPTFRVSGAIHAEALRLALRALTSQRCGAATHLGLPVDHPACHLEDGVLWGSPAKRVPATGGWHDAGDYGKYVVNGAYSAGLLLALAERCPRGDLRQSLLDEARWEVEWLLTMQAPDGSAYHKLTARKHPGVVPPAGDRSERLLFPPSSTATADLAAAMAIAARLYRDGDAALARRCAGASDSAWQWLQAHPDPLLFRNPPEVNTGTYGDKADTDERLWAAVERHRTTGDPPALERIREIAGPRRPAFTYAGSWADVANLALLSFLADRRVGSDDALQGAVADDLISFARRLAGRCRQHPLGVVLKPGDYYWGSNGVALNYALLLLEGGRRAGDAQVVQAGRDQVHYLFGRNALGISFVTGVGERCARHPHHAPSMLARGDAPVPGLLVGGPNSRQESGRSPFPATAYADVAENWTVNEPAINLNAELILILGLMEASPVGSR